MSADARARKRRARRRKGKHAKELRELAILIPAKDSIRRLNGHARTMRVGSVGWMDVTIGGVKHRFNHETTKVSVKGDVVSGTLVVFDEDEQTVRPAKSGEMPVGIMGKTEGSWEWKP